MSEQTGTEGNKLLAILCIGFIFLAGLMGYAFRSPIPIEDPERNKNINSFSCNELKDMSIQISNQGYSSNPNTPDSFNHPYSHSLEVINNVIQEKCK